MNFSSRFNSSKGNSDIEDIFSNPEPTRFSEPMMKTVSKANYESRKADVLRLYPGLTLVLAETFDGSEAFHNLNIQLLTRDYKTEINRFLQIQIRKSTFRYIILCVKIAAFQIFKLEKHSLTKVKFIDVFKNSESN